jgi:signal transduction histidine kinase
MSEPMTAATFKKVNWPPAIAPVELRIAHYSHELQTMLTLVQAALGLLQVANWQQLPESSRRLLTMALINSDRILQLLQLLEQEQLTRPPKPE